MSTTVLVSMNDQQLSELIESSLRRVLESKPEASADTSDTLLDTKEAARLTKYKETSIYGLVKRKKIPFCKMEGKLLFSRRELLEWIANGQQKIGGSHER